MEKVDSGKMKEKIFTIQSYGKGQYGANTASNRKDGFTDGEFFYEV